MSEHRVSIPPKIEATILAAAEEAGKTISEWLAEAAQDKVAELARLKQEKADQEARDAAGLRAAEELVAESEALYGPIPEEIWREAEEFVEFLRTGIPTPRSGVVET